jgi:hypothetical protein
MRTSSLGRLVAAAALLVTLLPGAAASAAPAAGPVPTLAPKAIAAALRADGIVVRREGRLTVERLSAHTRLRALVNDSDLYRVTIRGRYLPRALRYVVRAGGAPVAYGVPRRDEAALVAVTTDPAVLTERVTVKYGSTRTGPATVDETTTMPVGTARLGDPTPGPYEVTQTAYDLGDRAYQPPGLSSRVELVADVQHPTDLSAGPFPIVLFLHGNHSSCYLGNRARYEWPCRDGYEPIPNHEGYRYLATRLASYGYVVVSVSGNGVNVHGNYVDDTGMRQRGELLEKHLDLWDAWNTVGGDPFGTTFVGAIDMDEVGVMGHSRGGEGAVYQVIVDRERPDPYGIDAVLPLAPVDFTRPVIDGVDLGVILPYCDGDVSDLQGVHFFDDSRYTLPGDPTMKATVVPYGANHNFFNTIWSPSSGIPGSFDDGWNCDDRLTEREQRRVGVAYIVSFFRRYVGDDDARGTIWTGEKVPGTIGDARAAVSYLAPDDPATRLDIDRFTQPSDLIVNALGGDVVATKLGRYAWCVNVYDQPCVPGNLAYTDIHLSWSWFGPTPDGLQQAVIGWSRTAEKDGSLTFELPSPTDVSGYDAFGFRTVPNPGFDVNHGIEYQDLVVVLTDEDGTKARLGASEVGNDALAYPLAGRRGEQGHVIMNQIRFPLDGFEGVDLTRLASVRLAFSRIPAGVIDVSDVAFWAGEA